MDTIVIQWYVNKWPCILEHIGGSYWRDIGVGGSYWRDLTGFVRCKNPRHFSLF